MELSSTAPTELTPSQELVGRDTGGFDFSLKYRNDMLVASVPGTRVPKAKKTGTTICGVVYKDGVVLGADTRATEGTTISDKNCEKIHYLAPNIYCCGAGTAADTENVTLLISSQLELLRLATRSQSRVVTAMTQLKRRLFQYQGNVSAALVLGGVDVTGPHLYTIYPHGSTDKLPFVSMGSGSLAAMAVLEAGYKDELSREEAVKLVQNAIRAGIFNDLASGSNVDICIIAKPEAGAGVSTHPDTRAVAVEAAPLAIGGGAASALPGCPVVTYLRNYEKPNAVEPIRARITRPASRLIPKGATVILSESYEATGKAALPAAAGAGAGAGRGMDLEA